MLHAKSHLSHLKDEEKKTSMKRVVAAVVGKNVDGSFAISHTFLIHPQGLMKLTCKVARRNEVACGGLTETTGRSCKYIPYRKERRRTPLENENIQCHLCSVIHLDRFRERLSVWVSCAGILRCLGSNDRKLIRRLIHSLQANLHIVHGPLFAAIRVRDASNAGIASIAFRHVFLPLEKCP